MQADTPAQTAATKHAAASAASIGFAQMNAPRAVARPPITDSFQSLYGTAGPSLNGQFQKYLRQNDDDPHHRVLIKLSEDRAGLPAGGLRHHVTEAADPPPCGDSGQARVLQSSAAPGAGAGVRPTVSEGPLPVDADVETICLSDDEEETEGGVQCVDGTAAEHSSGFSTPGAAPGESATDKEASERPLTTIIGSKLRPV